MDSNNPPPSTLGKSLAGLFEAEMQLAAIRAALPAIPALAELDKQARNLGIADLMRPLHSGHQLDVEKRIYDLEAQLVAKNRALTTSQQDSEAKLRDLKAALTQLERQVQLQRLLRCVTQRAHPFIFDNEDFTARFAPGRQIQAYVMSLDIRRSTELMLKARTPSEFAAFITDVCRHLEEILKESYAFVDKFTGDGVLAFFPVQFAGNDAGRRALHAAYQAHRAFEAVYQRHRHNFSVILDEVGLGVGIDFGPVELVEISGALTVVGQPVVYACRLGGAPAGSTLLNVGAYQQLCQGSPAIADFEEYVLSIKSEGSIITFRSKIRESAIAPFADPEWLTLESGTGDSVPAPAPAQAAEGGAAANPPTG